MPPPADIELRVGQSATLDEGALEISLVQMVEDSRCPMNVMCVWMGRAVVSVHVTVDGVDRGDATVTLSPGPMTEQSTDLNATVDRYTLILGDLQPYPRAGQPQPLEQRVATIHVST